MTFAEQLFDAQSKWDNMDAEFLDHVCRILSVQRGEFPWDEHSIDSYDDSFELYACPAGGLVFSAEQQEEFRKLGFAQCWINYSDGTQQHYYWGFSRERPRNPDAQTTGGVVKEGEAR